jgi:hypothetical protein
MSPADAHGSGAAGFPFYGRRRQSAVALSGKAASRPAAGRVQAPIGNTSLQTWSDLRSDGELPGYADNPRAIDFCLCCPVRTDKSAAYRCRAMSITRDSGWSIAFERRDSDLAVTSARLHANWIFRTDFDSRCPTIAYDVRRSIRYEICCALQPFCSHTVGGRPSGVHVR